MKLKRTVVSQFIDNVLFFKLYIIVAADQSQSLESYRISDRLQNRRRTKAKPVIISVWYVRALLDRKWSNRPGRRTTLVARKFKRGIIDLTALREMRFMDFGKLTLYWSGKKLGRKTHRPKP